MLLPLLALSEKNKFLNLKYLHVSQKIQYFYL